VRYGANAISTQFHPEFSAEVMRAYIRRKRDALRDEGQCPDTLLADVTPTPVATRLLRGFLKEHVTAVREASAA